MDTHTILFLVIEHYKNDLIWDTYRILHTISNVSHHWYQVVWEVLDGLPRVKDLYNNWIVLHPEQMDVKSCIISQIFLEIIKISVAGWDEIPISNPEIIAWFSIAVISPHSKISTRDDYRLLIFTISLVGIETLRAHAITSLRNLPEDDKQHIKIIAHHMNISGEKTKEILYG